MKHSRILAAVAATPWAIEPNKGRELAALISRRTSGKKATRQELAAAAEVRAGREDRRRKPQPSNIAVIPLHGVMVQRADLIMEACGILSTEQVGRLVDLAASDPFVEAIILDVDSPGGSVFGTPELAAKVAAAAKRKKVIAVANSMAASAAYFVASQASELVVTPGGMVGSIGVYLMHVDESKALEMGGQVVTVIASSETKKGGADPGPLSEAWRRQMEQIVSGIYEQFVRAVAKGRGTSAHRVQTEFGNGGVLLADAAVAVGMADRVASLDEVLAQYGLRLSVDGDSLEPTASAGRNLAPRAASVMDPEIERRRALLDADNARDRAKQRDHEEYEKRLKLLRDDPLPTPVSRPVAQSHPPLTNRTILNAYHEAGHAFVAMALGSSSVTASMIPLPAGDAHVNYDRRGLSFLQHAVVAYAGAAAERLCPLSTGREFHLLSDTDRQARDGCPPELWPFAEEKAQEMLVANRDIVHALAKQLCQHRELTDAQIRATVFGPQRA